MKPKLLALLPCILLSTWLSALLCQQTPGSYQQALERESVLHSQTTPNTFAPYFDWLFHLPAHGLGVSLQWERSASSILLEAAGHTLALSVVAIVGIYLFAQLAGYAWFLFPQTVARSTLTGALAVFSTIPAFLFILLFLSLFGSSLDSADLATRIIGGGLLSAMASASSFTYLWIASLQRYTVEPYAQTARAQGGSIHRLYWKHAARFAAPETKESLKQVFLSCLLGSVLIEMVLEIPGLGKLTWDSWRYRDFPLVMALSVFFSVLYWLLDRGKDPWLQMA